MILPREVQGQKNGKLISNEARDLGIIFGACICVAIIISLVSFGYRSTGCLRRKREAVPPAPVPVQQIVEPMVLPTPEQVDALAPSKLFEPKEEPEMCIICFEQFVQGDASRMLPCSHLYHDGCIVEWLTQRRAICPLCNKSVEAKEVGSGGVEGGDGGVPGGVV